MLASLVPALGATLARAQGESFPAVHPIYVTIPESPRDGEAYRRFSAAALRLRLGAVETMDLPAPPPLRALEWLKAGRTAVQSQKFAEAQATLDAAVAEAIASGGGGLTPADESDLFLQQAMAIQHADWKDPPGAITTIEPAAARQAYLRAAVLAPDRLLLPRQFPPSVIACWRLATAEVKARPQGGITVQAAPTAQITIDGGNPLIAPATVPALPYGEHFVRVEDLGRQPWGAFIPTSGPVFSVQVPATAAITLSDEAAATQARRQGAPFALVAALAPGDSPQMELRLLEAFTGKRRDATTTSFLPDAAPLEAAVMRLDEEARRAVMTEPAAPGLDPPLPISSIPVTPAGQNPGGSQSPQDWAQGHKPLLIAVGATLATALVLGLVVALGNK